MIYEPFFLKLNRRETGITNICFMKQLISTPISKFLNHCAQTQNLRAIQKLHAHLLRSGLFVTSPNLQTQLLFTYNICLNVNSLKTLTHFSKCLNPKNYLPFNSIISQCSQNGFDSHALRAFSFMHCKNVYIDSYALCSSVKSACFLKDIHFGKLLHAYVKKSGWLASVFVGSALVDFYMKLSYINDATKVFDEIPLKNTVCVNALLTGYAEAKMWVRVTELFRRMPVLKLAVDSFTLSAALRACAALHALHLGKQIHGILMRNVIEFGHDIYLQSLLIEMYGKFGLLESAKRIFDMVGYEKIETRRKDVILWSSMLGAHGKNGNYKEVVLFFEDMLMKGVRPDGVAFLIVISACSHTGQVDLGMEYFESMTRYGVVPSQEHYSCLIDLLCRAGELEKAWKLVSDITHYNNEVCGVSMWGALLSACNECGNVKLGKLAAQRALELEPENVGVYVLLSNMYARNGMWDEIEGVREVIKRRGLKRENGWSLVDKGS